MAALTGLLKDGIAGAALATLELDRDGVSEVAIGAPLTGRGVDGNGEVFVVFAGAVGELSPGPDVVKLTLASSSKYRRFGASLAAVGDLDGDGASELLVGTGNAGPGTGIEPARAYLFSGRSIAEARATPPYLLTTEACVTIFEVPVVDASEQGLVAAAAGDVDGDGTPDLALGQPGAPGDPAGEPAPGAGAVHLVFGGALPGVLDLSAPGAGLTIRGEASGDQLGAALVGGPDLDDDLRSELLVGAPGRGQLLVFSGATLQRGSTVEPGDAAAAFPREPDAATAGPAGRQLGAALAVHPGTPALVAVCAPGPAFDGTEEPATGSCTLLELGAGLSLQERATVTGQAGISGSTGSAVAFLPGPSPRLVISGAWVGGRLEEQGAIYLLEVEGLEGSFELPRPGSSRLGWMGRHHLGFALAAGGTAAAPELLAGATGAGPAPGQAFGAVYRLPLSLLTDAPSP